MNTVITMENHAENYLSERRQLGFGLRSPGYTVPVLLAILMH
jgi:hypothetical protein